MNDRFTPTIDARTASALLASMVLHQTEMAFMLLGRAPNPETGEFVHEPETAKLLIDQLEMLAIKTRGNLDENESELLHQSIATLQMAFVEAVDQPPKASAQRRAEPATKPRPAESASSLSQNLAPPEGHKKFSKTY